MTQYSDVSKQKKNNKLKHFSYASVAARGSIWKFEEFKDNEEDDDDTDDDTFCDKLCGRHFVSQL